MTTRWVTLEKASEITGLGVQFFHERTGTAGMWPEGKVWKWFEGRKLVDLVALYSFIDERPSVASQRGRRRSATTCENKTPAPPA